VNLNSVADVCISGLNTYPELKEFAAPERIIYPKLIDETCQKAKFTDEDLPNLSKAVCVAKKVGESLGRSKILQR
jgi:hypothetical protein